MRTLLLLLVAMPLWAQFPVHLDLSGNWKYNEHDNSAFAAPALDDSSWSVFPIPARLRPVFGIHWLRHRFDVPAATPSARLQLAR